MGLDDKLVLSRFVAGKDEQFDAPRCRERRGLRRPGKYRYLSGQERRHPLCRGGEKYQLALNSITGEKTRIVGRPKRDAVAADRRVADFQPVDFLRLSAQGVLKKDCKSEGRAAKLEKAEFGAWHLHEFFSRAEIPLAIICL